MSSSVFSQNIFQELTNPVYLFQGIVLRRGAKGTGMKSVELALSMCDVVDIYGFTVDPGYTEWSLTFSLFIFFFSISRLLSLLFFYRTRYFSEPKKGHNPLQGRAYYQLLECLGVSFSHFLDNGPRQIQPAIKIVCFGVKPQVIRIHSPMRAERAHHWSDVPAREAIMRAYGAAWRVKTGRRGPTPFGRCKVWGRVDPEKPGPVSGSPDMGEARKNSNYSKWETMPLESLRKEAQAHMAQTGHVSLYKMDGNRLDDLVCVRHDDHSK